jgi:N,N'-diacetyllegionaminate synthase
MTHVEIVVELGQTHGGSLERALQLIERVKRAGADTAKFQDHRGHAGPRRAYWARTALTTPGYRCLRERCDDVGLRFLVSPFTVQAVDELNGIVDRWKVGSAQVMDPMVCSAIASRPELPILASDGLCTAKEQSAFQERFPHAEWLRCTSVYPTPPECVSLPDEHYAGISDHSGTIWPSLAAVARGARVIEVHVCDKATDLGPDWASSLDWSELAQLVQGIRFLERVGTVDVHELPIWQAQREKYGLPSEDSTKRRVR